MDGSIRRRLENETVGEEEDVPPLPALPETTAYWSREPYAWSTSIQDYTPPMLTSSHCSKAIYKLFRNTYESDVGDLDPYQPNFLLSVVTESSSHPSGLDALYAQPWMYAGPGLGNMDECPLQTCMAGGRKTDSITFASVCTVPECSAYDLAADDFASTMARQLQFATSGSIPLPTETIELAHEYISLFHRIADVNKFLKTGWTCGDFIVPFDLFPFGLLYVGCGLVLAVLSILGTTCKRPRQQQLLHRMETHQPFARKGAGSVSTASTVIDEMSSLLQQNRPPIFYESSFDSANDSDSAKLLENGHQTTTQPAADSVDRSNRFWSAFDASSHLQRLVSPDHTETACLDGLRVGSIFWIMLGHVMAIQSSSGAGYSNPANFLPPSGITTTLAGQLLFSSRLAVDTFLTISGFLVVYVLDNKLRIVSDPPNQEIVSSSFWKRVVLRYIAKIPMLLAVRLGRVIPLYAMTLGFYTQIAPHLGGGPFWYQWIALLKPCHDAVWTNFLFVNNFVPFDTQTTSTCFYHSWYLAVDMQLFVVAPFLIFWFQFNSQQGKFVTLSLCILSAAASAYLSYARSWSVNTFDGVLVARYDMEAYAKPHIRAQAYLLGMYTAMILISDPRRLEWQRSPKAIPCGSESGSWRAVYTWKHRCMMFVALAMMGAVTFGTVTGAYARRPCTYEEDPYIDDCGSSWSPMTTLVYTALSRTVWSMGTAAIIHLCVGRGCWGAGDNNVVSSILSWRCWTPLSHLSFGAYLIHPIVIFIWQLGGREKQVFRLLSFGMDFLSVCVVSYVAALIASTVVEFPMAALWKTFVANRYPNQRYTADKTECMPNVDFTQPSNHDIDQHESRVSSMSTSPLTPQHSS